MFYVILFILFHTDGKEIDLSSQKYIADLSGLRIMSITSKDQGQYTCVGTNQGGQAQSQAQLIVQGKNRH